MKQFIVNFLLYVVLIGPSFGQGKFFKTFADNGYDVGQGIVQLEDSSYMVTGSSSSFLDAPSQVYMMKVDKFGQHEWARNYGGSESDWGRRILNWNDSIFFLTGYSNSFGQGDFDFYMAKVDKNGEFISEKTYGGTGWEKLNDALITPDSSIVMVGQTSSTENGNSNFYIVKTDKNGDTLWTRNFGSTGEDVLHSVKQLDNNTFYAVGGYYNADSSLVKGAVVRFLADGTVDWVKQYGKYGEYVLHDFYFLWSMMYAGGTRKHPIDGDQDEYLLRLDQAGVLESEENNHDAGDVIIDGICKYGNDGNVYVASNIKNEFSAGGSFDVIINRFYESLYWNVLAMLVPFIMDDEHGEIIGTSDGGAVSVGSIQSVELGGRGIYVLKIGENDDFPAIDFGNTQSLVYLTENASVNNVTIFPNPATDLIHFKVDDSEAVKVTFSDINGRSLLEENISFEKSIDVSEWNSGVYYVSIEFLDGRKAVRKLLVTN